MGKSTGSSNIYTTGHVKKRREQVKEHLDAYIQKNGLSDAYKDSIIEHSKMFYHIMKERRVSVEKYCNALMFVVCKVYGLSDIDAYTAVFPDRMAQHEEEVAKRKAMKVAEININAYVRAYKNSETVKEMLTFMRTPLYMVHADLIEESLDCLREIIRNPKAAFGTKVNACKVALDALKPDEKIQAIQQNNVTVNAVGKDAINSLNKTLMELAKSQKELIASGVNADEVYVVDEQR